MIAVLGPGGVGGLLAGALDRAGVAVTVVARESTAELIASRGIRVHSELLGEFSSSPPAVARLTKPVTALIVATKATGLQDALQRVSVAPAVVLPLLNGLEHMAVLRARFPPREDGRDPVLAGSVRVQAQRTAPGVIAHTSSFLQVEMASHDARAREAMMSLTTTFKRAGVDAAVIGSEAQVLWSKLVRLNALACVTSAYDLPIGPIRDTPELHDELIAAVNEGAAIARAEGSYVAAEQTLREIDQLGPEATSSMRRDIAAGEPSELDAIVGAVLRAGARHGIPTPTIAQLLDTIVKRTGLPAPSV